MNMHQVIDHKLKNLLQTLLLIVGMSLLLASISRLLLGPELWMWVLAALIIVLLSVPRLSPQWLLRLYQAKPVGFQHSPQLISILQNISDRADLPQCPQLFWVPSRTLNAFAVGSRHDSAIAVTDGLLRRLNTRELAGVLAHEVSHIRNNDLQLMMLADLFTRLTHSLSMVGLLMIFVSLPFMLVGAVSISIWGMLLLVISPSISALLQLGLSRVREFDADLDAARLTEDPRGLASALSKIEQQGIGLWQRIFMPSYHNQQPSVLRTHPDTSARVKRLLALHHSSQLNHNEYLPEGSLRSHITNLRPIKAKPRHRHFRGIWQ